MFDVFLLNAIPVFANIPIAEFLNE